MEKGWAYLFVDGGGMVFGDVVGSVQAAPLPVDHELSLGFTVLQPVEVHVDSFGASLFDGLVADAFGGGVVSLDSCWRLGVS